MDDLISRKAAIDALKRAAYWQDAERKISELPAVNAVPVEWLKQIQAGCVCDTVQVPMYVAIGWLIDMWQQEQEG